MAAAGKWWRLIAAAAVITALLAGIVAVLQPKRYRASAIAAVTASGENVTPGDLYRGVEVLEQRTIVATVAALASIPETERQALAVSGRSRDRYTILAAVLPNTNLVRIDVEGVDAATAARIANRVPAILAAQTRAMYKLYGVATVSAAETPTAKVFPRTSRAIAAGAIIGLLIGIGIALGLESLHKKTFAIVPGP
jgi:capsular polysaccharide biosynthesis protein